MANYILRLLCMTSGEYKDANKHRAKFAPARNKYKISERIVCELFSFVLHVFMCLLLPHDILFSCAVERSIRILHMIVCVYVNE